MQTCIVHLVRSSLRYVNYRDRKQVASALRPIYTAPNADAALDELDAFEREWGERYPPTVAAWRTSWEHVIPFLALPVDLRPAVYDTDENVRGSVARGGLVSGWIGRAGCSEGRRSAPVASFSRRTAGDHADFGHAAAPPSVAAGVGEAVSGR